VPKLELCGAELLSRLIAEVAGMSAFEGKFYCWSDSAVALLWIGDQPPRFNMFVANRVAAIQELTESVEWRYVPTFLNPADILSRGAFPAELNESPLWAHGPKFLCGPKADWPTPITAERPTLEVCRRILLTKSPYEGIVAGSKFANFFAALQRIFGFVYKFSSRIHRPTLTMSDLQGGTCCCFVLSNAHIYGMTSNHFSQREWCTPPALSHLFRHSLTNLGFLEWMAG